MKNGDINIIRITLTTNLFTDERYKRMQGNKQFEKSFNETYYLERKSINK